jgi:excisionase family DNA binding protein
MEKIKGTEEILTLSEVARYLKLAEKTVLRMTHKGEIPCFKIASQWRFLRSQIDEWLLANSTKEHAAHNHKIQTAETINSYIEEKNALVPLSRLTGKDFIILNLVPGNQYSVLKQLTEPLFQAGIIEDQEKFIERLRARENMTSTYIGQGVALPHVRYPEDNKASRPAVVIGLCPAGTEFDVPGGDLVRLFFMIYSSSEIVHLRILAKINSLLRQNGNIAKLIKTGKKEEILKMLMQEEQKLL